MRAKTSSMLMAGVVCLMAVAIVRGIAAQVAPGTSQATSTTTTASVTKLGSATEQKTTATSTAVTSPTQRLARDVFSCVP
jgi:hypothetical protein